MRTIKFRGKIAELNLGCDKNVGDWVYGDLHLLSKIPHIHTNSRKYIIDTETIGQFTGLQDKNGKEIYEGDILVWGKSQPIIVIFKHGSFGYTYPEDWYHSFAENSNFTFNPLNTDIHFKVIGNIHDNPELLKGE